MRRQRRQRRDERTQDARRAGEQLRQARDDLREAQAYQDAKLEQVQLSVQSGEELVILFPSRARNGALQSIIRALSAYQDDPGLLHISKGPLSRD